MNGCDMHKYQPIRTGNPPITQEWLGIWYSPLRDEPDPEKLDLTRRLCLQPWRVIPASRASDPFTTAAALKRDYATLGIQKDVYIFVPGQRFDRFGTRQGRGGGWMDKFLASIPRTWLRIGICTPQYWSDAPLFRESWDEPMDWIINTSAANDWPDQADQG